jgi:O-methyltransferase
MFGVYCDPTRYDPRLRSLKYRSPGAKRACDEFFVDKPEKVSVLYAGDYTNGYFRRR